MANRSRRLRKKLRVDEFQEMGFDISFNFPVGTAEETIDAVVDALIDEGIEPRKLAFAGPGWSPSCSISGTASRPDI